MPYESRYRPAMLTGSVSVILVHIYVDYLILFIYLDIFTLNFKLLIRIIALLYSIRDIFVPFILLKFLFIYSNVKRL